MFSGQVSPLRSMPGFWMAPYRGNQGNDRATSVLQVYRIRRAWSRVRNQLWVGQLHASDAHRGNSSGPTLGNRSGARPNGTAEGLKIGGVVVTLLQNSARNERRSLSYGLAAPIFGEPIALCGILPRAIDVHVLSIGAKKSAFSNSLSAK